MRWLPNGQTSTGARELGQWSEGSFVVTVPEEDCYDPAVLDVLRSARAQVAAVA
jgi:hypothetical protein